MTHHPVHEVPALQRCQSTDKFAQQNLVRPQTVRKRYSQSGSYFGVRPTKLPNGRLSWPTVVNVLTPTFQGD